ncbi:MAG: Uncharacterized protein FD155_1925 [Bacteroidetes bacterium]|nr:MAG: Uncharacterized protein FD155_1925 [Bacteroidota bacterium]
MKKILFYLIIASLNFLFINIAGADTNKNLQFDNAALKDNSPRYAELHLPVQYRGLTLPDVVDNSQNMYFRPIFSQVGASCGQASSIAYHFTYEMCRERDVPANVEANQYPSHFIYNFMGYDGYYGVNYLHSLEMVKAIGTPDIQTYGGIAIDEGVVWISGYDTYYEAMTNRIGEIKMIRTETVEGLMNLKHWLAHHHEGAVTGGVANFAAGSPYGMVNIPIGTPEAGKKLMALFPGNVATHAMTIVGYNDSIRYDTNGDGMYTNHLDVNNDGVVDLKDWEIGAFKVANSYGDAWGDAGYFYMMYRLCAMNEAYGGLWGNMVHVMEVKGDYEPEMAVKVTLKHNLREQIRVVVGVSSDTSLNAPQHTLNFPVFNYQGGKHYMQGGTAVESNKTIEFGLDITPLLSYLEPGMPADFYLEIHENDPLSAGEGEIISFSLMDYTIGNLVEISCEQENVTLNNNSITSLHVSHSPVFESVDILTDQIPLFDAGYSMQAEGGAQPYQWDLLTPYHQQTIDFVFPTVENEQLVTEAPYHKYATKSLEFDFPFYGEVFNKVYVNEAGFILFEPDIFPWRYNRDTYHMFREMKNISAFLFSPVLYYEGTKQPEGMWYEGDETHATFRWKKNLTYYDNVIGYGEFAVKLFPDGGVEFYFNDIEVNENILWFSGVSAGEGKEHTLLTGSNSRSYPQNSAYRLTPTLIPDGIDLTDEGFFTSLPSEMQQIANLTFKVTDDRGVFETKLLQFSNDLRFECELHTNDNLSPHNGSEVAVKLKLTNVSQQDISAINASFTINDPNATVTNGQAVISQLPAGATVEIPDAFSFTISDFCPDRQHLLAELVFNSSIGIRTGNIAIEVFSSILQLTDYEINDFDNERLDPGETAPVKLYVSNFGSVLAEDVTVSFTSADSYIEINPQNPQNIGGITPSGMSYATFSVAVSSQCPIEHVAQFVVTIIDGSGVERVETINMPIGQYPVYLINKATNQISVNSMMVALDSLNIDYEYAEQLTGEIHKYRAAFICQGTYGTTINLTQDEVDILETYLNNGGNAYRESYFNWGGNGTITNLFGVNNEILATPQTIYALSGVSNSGFDQLEFDFSGAFSFQYYRLIPKFSGAFPVLHSDAGLNAYTAVAYQAPNYRTIASYFEFSSCGDEYGLQGREDLMRAILTFFEMEHLILNANEKPDDGSKLIFAAIYPNPFSNHFVLEIKNLQQSKNTISMMSMDGATLFEKVVYATSNQSVIRIESDEIISISNNLKAGVYLLKIENNTGTQVLKVVRM